MHLLLLKYQSLLKEMEKKVKNLKKNKNKKMKEFTNLSLQKCSVGS